MRTLVQYLITFCSRLGATSDVIFASSFVWPIVPEKPVKFRDPCLNRPREISPEAVEGGIFDSFFRDNFGPEAASDVISGTIVELESIGVDVRVKFDFN